MLTGYWTGLCVSVELTGSPWRTWGKWSSWSRTVVSQMLEPTELDKFSCWDCTFCFVAMVLLKHRSSGLLQQAALPAAHTGLAWLAFDQGAKSIWSSWRCVHIKNCRHCVLPCNTLDNLKSRAKGKATNADKPRFREIHRLYKIVNFWGPQRLLYCVPLSLDVCLASSSPLALCRVGGDQRSASVGGGK